MIAPDDIEKMIRLAITEACMNAGAAHGRSRRDRAVEAATSKVMAMVRRVTEDRGRLQEALRRYGDRIGMANAPPHLQQEIDEAMSGGGA